MGDPKCLNPLNKKRDYLRLHLKWLFNYSYAGF